MTTDLDNSKAIQADKVCRNYSRQALITAQVLSLLAILLGFAVLAEWVLNLNLLFWLPGRIGETADCAVCFSLCGMAMLLGPLTPSRRW
jgi:hypothetical protein